MIDKETHLNNKIAQSERATVTRFAAEYLLLLCNPNLLDIFSAEVMHVHGATSKEKAGFIAELQHSGAMEIIDGTYTVTSKGREISDKLFAAATKFDSARPSGDTPDHST